MLALLTAASLLASFASAADNYTQATCNPGFFAQRRVSIATAPYPFLGVLPVVPTFRNTSGTAPVFNGPPTEPGTVRTWLWANGPIPGANRTNHTMTETLEYYSYPSAAAAGRPQQPYEIVYSGAPFTYSNGLYSPMNTTIYIVYNSLVVSSVCGGEAARINNTIIYCANYAGERVQGTEPSQTVSDVVVTDIYSYSLANLLSNTYPYRGSNFYACATINTTNPAVCNNGAYNGTTGVLIDGSYTGLNAAAYLVPGLVAGTNGSTSAANGTASSASRVGSSTSGVTGGAGSVAATGSASGTPLGQTTGSTRTGASRTSTTAGLVLQSVNAAPFLPQPALEAILLGGIALAVL